MGTLRRARTSPHQARVLPALLLAVLWTLCLPGLAQAALATAYKVLHSFPLPASQLPVTPSGLLQAADGSFYGTTYYGGAANLGSVFMLAPPGSLTTFYSFTGQTDGIYPYPSACLIQDSEGNFYGTTWMGGDSDLGTVFSLTPTGSPATLHGFSGTDGQYPQASLIRDAVGTLYGTTTEGGGPGYGTVFTLTPAGSFTTLHLFSGTDGAHPAAGLIRDSVGNLYGTTANGGASDQGTVFKLTPTGTLSTLHTFSGKPDGANPQGNLILDAGGATLYGTTYSGGASDLGTVFKLTLTGTPTLTILHEFTGTDGASPSAGLLQGAEGNLYGTTFGSCTYGDTACTSGYGTVFRLATDGSAFTTLHTFDGAKGANPQTPLIQGSDGHFHGTTSRGGSTTGGVVFVLRVGNPLTVTLTGTGTGTVTSTPAGISCPGTCTEVFPVTASVTLTATAATGSTFTGWTGAGCTGTDPCTVSMTEARSVTATFTLQNFALTVTKAGTGAGNVISTVPGGAITCGATCSASFNYGTSVLLTASAAVGSTFTGWSGNGINCPGTGACSLTMDQARSVTANFDDTTPPTVTHTPLTSWAVPTPPTPTQSIPITATITDNIAVQEATLYCRTTGASTYTAVTLTAPGPTFNWTIPAGAVTKTGIDYYLKAQDKKGNPQILPSTAPGKPYSVVVGTTVFTDDPLGVGKTAVRAVHFTELRTAINALRTAKYSLPAFVWSTPGPAAGGTVRALHLTELRTALTATALNAAYKAKFGKEITFSEPVTAGVAIKASHLSELRMYVRGLE